MEPELTFPRPLSYWRSVIFAVLLSVVGQGLLAAAVALGGNPAIGAVAAAVLAISSIILIMAAAVRTARSHGPFRAGAQVDGREGIRT